MNTRVVWSLVLAVTIGFSPMAIAAQKDNDKGKTAKSSQVSKGSDRGDAWHGKDWKSGSASKSSAKTNQGVRVVQYQAPATRPAAKLVSTRPASEYRYYLTENEDRYDYFSAHYGVPQAKAASEGTTTKPADVLGYVPPDNSHNPFIYRRGQ